MKRIIYINKVKLESHIPAVNFSLFNAYTFAQAGVESYLMVQNEKTDFDEDQIYKIFDLEPLDNFHLKVYPQKKYLGIKTNQWFYIKAFSDVQKLYHRNRIDAVISRDPGALPYLVWLKSKFGISVFYQPHNFYIDLSIRPDLTPENAKKYHLLEKYFIPKMTALLCLQNAQSEWYRRYFPMQKILVLKPGLIHFRPLKIDNYKNKLIGYIGSLKWIKGVDILLQAFELIKDKGFKLLLIGGRDQNEISPIQQKINESNLQTLVKITGWIPFSSVEDYLNEISVGIIPLHDTFYNRYLTAPNKLFDYLSRGIPIVASDLPSIRDFVSQDEGIKFFKAGEAEDLARAVLEIFDNYKKYRLVRNSALDLAKKNLWKDRAASILKEIGFNQK